MTSPSPGDGHLTVTVRPATTTVGLPESAKIRYGGLNTHSGLRFWEGVRLPTVLGPRLAHPEETFTSVRARCLISIHVDSCPAYPTAAGQCGKEW